MVHGCQTCLRVIKNPSEGLYLNSVSSNLDEIPLKEKLADCVPELILDSIANAVLCHSCVETLVRAYKFKQKCLDAQQKIYGYLQQMPLHTEINLGKIAVYYQRLEIITRGGEPTVADVSTNANNALQMPHKCTLCEFSCLDKCLMRLHKILHKTKSPPYKCDQCSFIFPTRELLLDHLATHTNENPYSCTLCDFLTSSYKELKIHGWSHRKAFQCSICWKRFLYTHELNAHMDIHNDEQEAKRYQCGWCDFKCDGLKNLKGHLNSYHQITHKCGKCTVECRSQLGLAEHMRRVHGKLAEGDLYESINFSSNDDVIIVPDDEDENNETVNVHEYLETFNPLNVVENTNFRDSDQKGVRKRSLICRKCSVEFKSRGSLKNHSKRCTANTCNLKTQEFLAENPTDGPENINTDSACGGTNMNNYESPAFECMNRFNNTSEVYKNISTDVNVFKNNTTQDSIPKNVKCWKCLAEFQSFVSFDYHIKNCTSYEADYVRENSERNYLTTDGWRDTHKRDLNLSQRKIHQCPQCPMTATSRRSLKSHQKMIHRKFPKLDLLILDDEGLDTNNENVGVLKCKECSFEFANRADRASHWWLIHSNNAKANLNCLNLSNNIDIEHESQCLNNITSDSNKIVDSNAHENVQQMLPANMERIVVPSISGVQENFDSSVFEKDSSTKVIDLLENISASALPNSTDHTSDILHANRNIQGTTLPQYTAPVNVPNPNQNVNMNIQGKVPQNMSGTDKLYHCRCCPSGHSTKTKLRNHWRKTHKLSITHLTPSGRALDASILQVTNKMQNMEVNVQETDPAQSTATHSCENSNVNSEKHVNIEEKSNLNQQMNNVSENINKNLQLNKSDKPKQMKKCKICSFEYQNRKDRMEHWRLTHSPRVLENLNLSGLPKNTDIERESLNKNNQSCNINQDENATNIVVFNVKNVNSSIHASESKDTNIEMTLLPEDMDMNAVPNIVDVNIQGYFEETNVALNILSVTNISENVEPSIELNNKNKELNNIKVNQNLDIIIQEQANIASNILQVTNKIENMEPNIQLTNQNAGPVNVTSANQNLKMHIEGEVPQNRERKDSEPIGKLYQCQSCPVLCMSKRGLRSHRRKAHKQGPEVDLRTPSQSKTHEDKLGSFEINNQVSNATGANILQVTNTVQNIAVNIQATDPAHSAATYACQNSNVNSVNNVNMEEKSNLNNQTTNVSGNTNRNLSSNENDKPQRGKKCRRCSFEYENRKALNEHWSVTHSLRALENAKLSDPSKKTDFEHERVDKNNQSCNINKDENAANIVVFNVQENVNSKVNVSENKSTNIEVTNLIENRDTNAVPSNVDQNPEINIQGCYEQINVASNILPTIDISENHQKRGKKDSDPIGKLYQCKSCPFLCPSRSGLRSHRRAHKQGHEVDLRTPSQFKTHEDKRGSFEINKQVSNAAGLNILQVTNAVQNMESNIQATDLVQSTVTHTCQNSNVNSVKDVNIEEKLNLTNQATNVGKNTNRNLRSNKSDNRKQVRKCKKCSFECQTRKALSEHWKITHSLCVLENLKLSNPSKKSDLELRNLDKNNQSCNINKNENARNDQTIRVQDIVDLNTQTTNELKNIFINSLHGANVNKIPDKNVQEISESKNLEENNVGDVNKNLNNIQVASISENLEEGHVTNIQKNATNSGNVKKNDMDLVMKLYQCSQCPESRWTDNALSYHRRKTHGKLSSMLDLKSSDECETLNSDNQISHENQPLNIQESASDIQVPSLEETTNKKNLGFEENAVPKRVIKCKKCSFECENRKITYSHWKLVHSKWAEANMKLLNQFDSINSSEENLDAINPPLNVNVQEYTDNAQVTKTKEKLDFDIILHLPNEGVQIDTNVQMAHSTQDIDRNESDTYENLKIDIPTSDVQEKKIDLNTLHRTNSEGNVKTVENIDSNDIPTTEHENLNITTQSSNSVEKFGPNISQMINAGENNVELIIPESIAPTIVTSENKQRLNTDNPYEGSDMNYQTNDQPQNTQSKDINDIEFDEPITYSCSLCSLTCESYNSLFWHMIKIHKKTIKEWKLLRPPKPKKHKKKKLEITQNDKRKKNMKCKLCPFEYSCKKERKVHWRLMHSKFAQMNLEAANQSNLDVERGRVSNQELNENIVIVPKNLNSLDLICENLDTNILTMIQENTETNVTEEQESMEMKRVGVKRKRTDIIDDEDDETMNMKNWAPLGEENSDTAVVTIKQENVNPHIVTNSRKNMGRENFLAVKRKNLDTISVIVKREKLDMNVTTNIGEDMNMAHSASVKCENLGMGVVTIKQENVYTNDITDCENSEETSVTVKHENLNIDVAMDECKDFDTIAFTMKQENPGPTSVDDCKKVDVTAMTVKQENLDATNSTSDGVTGVTVKQENLYAEIAVDKYENFDAAVIVKEENLDDSSVDDDKKPDVTTVNAKQENIDPTNSINDGRKSNITGTTVKQENLNAEVAVDEHENLDASAVNVKEENLDTTSIDDDKKLDVTMVTVKQENDVTNSNQNGENSDITGGIVKQENLCEEMAVNEHANFDMRAVIVKEENPDTTSVDGEKHPDKIAATVKQEIVHTSVATDNGEV